MAAIRSTVLFLWIAVLACLTTACGSSPIQQPLTPGPNIQLPKDNHLPSLDLITVDSRSGMLYVSHSSRAALDVIDTRTRKLVGSVSPLIDIKATALTPDPNIVFTSDGGENGVAVIDVGALKVVQRIDVSGSPDDIAYDPVNDVVAVSVPTRKKIVLINRTARKVVASVALPGTSELMTVDDRTGRLFVAINDKDEVAIIDLASQTITSTYKGCNIKEPTGIAFDPDQGRLFVADAGALMSAIDVVLDRCLGVIDIGHGADQVAFNPHLHHVYSANTGSRTISVVDSVSLKPLGVVGTGPDASSVATDSATDEVYVVIGRAGIVGTYHDP